MSKNDSKKNHPDHVKQISRLRRVKGQIEGIEKMIVERRYCPDIITQLRAASSALKSLERTVLETHFQHCVTDAFLSKDESDKKRKIKDIMDLFVRN